MYLVAERGGRIEKEDAAQDRLISLLYNHAAGRLFLKPIVSPIVSKVIGRFFDTRVSRVLIEPFIRRNKIDMADYEKREFASYNDFFTRRLASGAREVRQEPEVFVSPCDSRLSVCKIDEKNIFSIKHTCYTVESLLRNRELAQRYVGGYAWIFRLRVDDYHRYIFVDGGRSARRMRSETAPSMHTMRTAT